MISELCLKKKVFIVGVFRGYGKPKCPNEYLEEFISELVPLINDGFLTEEGEIITVVLSALICDAPAKSFVLCTNGHTALMGNTLIIDCVFHLMKNILNLI